MKEAGSPIWSVVKLVEIFGDFPDLPFDVCLLDLPGLNDSNQNRTAHTYQNIAKCDKLAVVANAKAALNHESDLDMLNRGVFHETSSPSDIIICATKVDLADGDIDRLAAEDEQFREIEEPKRNATIAVWLSFFEYIYISICSTSI